MFRLGAHAWCSYGNHLIVGSGVCTFQSALVTATSPCVSAGQRIGVHELFAARRYRATARGFVACRDVIKPLFGGFTRLPVHADLGYETTVVVGIYIDGNATVAGQERVGTVSSSDREDSVESGCTRCWW